MAEENLKKSRYNESQNKATQKYVKKNYDEIKIRIRKDGKINKEILKQHAEAQGESLNGFINRAIDETVERDNEKS